ncbi:hypothetical protein [Myroides injenensis]|uniref:hypothetical protein n=1 Tax=Myroides injenensis TaxID=1183151 RepID=UPI0018726280|nr:hypothetical protein [Myroides injenensis]
MKKFLFIIVTLLVFRPVVPLIDYAVNYEYISTVLCVNKDIPEMHCNGQCYLMKQLAQAVKEEQGKDAIKKVCDIAFSLMYFDTVLHIELHKIIVSNIKKVSDIYKESISAVFVTINLRPPLV